MTVSDTLQTTKHDLKYLDQSLIYNAHNIKMYEAMQCAMDGSYQKAVTCSTETLWNCWRHLCMSSLKRLYSVLQSVTLFMRLTQQENRFVMES